MNKKQIIVGTCTLVAVLVVGMSYMLHKQQETPEVPKVSYENVEQREGVLAHEEIGIELPLGGNASGNVPYQKPITESQFEMELALLEDYYKGSYTVENPYVVVNPYEIAPLTALAIFETKEPSRIEVTIKGQQGGKNITYKLEDYMTHHEVPLLWLYGGMENQVEIKAVTQTDITTISEIQVVTDALPTYMTDKQIKVTTKEREMTDGLTLLIDDQRTVVDEDGAIRWYLGVTSATSGVEEILDNGHLLMPLDAYARWTRFYEMDWLGKVYWSYANPESMNHDATELPNGNILAICGGNLVEIERGTGKVIKEIDYNDIFKNQGSLEIRTRGDYDWFHENTVIYDDGSVIISARNQNMIVKLNYQTEKVEWILGSNSPYHLKYKLKYLSPIGENFEWFYSQHQPSILPDLDNDPHTMDLLVFDNGVHRSYEEETALKPEEMYSRIVHYRINETAMIVEQIWDAGKEQGLPFYSEIHSGAQYLEEKGHYLGVFDASSSHDMATWTDFFNTQEHDYTSKVVEFGKNKEILHQIEAVSPLYRAYRVKPQEMMKGFTSLGTYKGNYTIPEAITPLKSTMSTAYRAFTMRFKNCQMATSS